MQSDNLQKYIKIFVEEFEGVNVDDAIKIAIENLKMSKEELQIKILYEGEPGLFGLEGQKPARIKVYPNVAKVENIIKFYTIKLLEFIKNDIIYIDVKIENKIVNVMIVVSAETALKKVLSKDVYNSFLILMESFVSQILPEYKVNINFIKSTSAK